MRAAAAPLGLLVAALIATAAPEAALSPNVRGTFARSAQVVACYPGEPCDPPPQAAFLVFSRTGHSTRVRLGADGTFAVRLAGGLYRVSLRPGHGSTVSPATLRVPRSGVIHPRFRERATSQPVPR